MTTHRIPVYGADVVVNAQFGAGETFQNNAESSSRDVEATGLEPYSVGIRNPVAVVIDVDVGDEVFAASLIWIESVGETVEGSDWHVRLLFESTIEKTFSARPV